MDSALSRLASTPLPAPAGEPEMPGPFGYVSDGFPDGLHFSHKPWTGLHLLVNSTGPVFSYAQFQAWGDARAEHARRVAMEEAAKLRSAGGQLSNCAFNLAQRNPGQFTARDIDALDTARKNWDAAIRAAAPPQGETR